MTDTDARDARTRASVAVRFQAPLLPPLADVAAYYRLAEERRWYSNDGPCLQLLEQRLAAYVGEGARCLGVTNATVGLLLALREAATPVPGRDLVALPSWTFVASAAAVVWAGFRPLFLDVDADSWQLDPTAVEDVLGDRSDVAAVLACSTFGTAPPAGTRRRWEEACRTAGVPLVVDSAAGFGALDEDGRCLGLQGDVEVFSFHATKPFPVGEGGLIVTGSPERRQRLGEWVNFGFDADRRVTVPGLNGKMSELAAATALAALDRYPDVLAGRRARAAALRGELTSLGYASQRGAEGSTVQFVPALAASQRVRDRVLREAAADSVEVRTYYDTPCHRHAPYADAPRHGDLPVTEDLSRRALSLPMADDLTDAAAERVLAACRRAVA